MAATQFSMPDHIRCGRSLYYLTWPRLLLLSLIVTLAVVLMTAATEYAVLGDIPTEMPTTTGKTVVVRRKSAVRKVEHHATSSGIVGRFCVLLESTHYLGRWKVAVPEQGGLPSQAKVESYCDWKAQTSTDISFRMCTYSKDVDTQVSAYIHKEGFWSGFKRDVFQRLLPVIHDRKQKRHVVIDVGANIGFLSMLAATRGYDVIALEPSLQSVIRLVFSAVANKLRVVEDPKEWSRLTAEESDETPAILTYINAGSDSYNAAALRYVQDNPGASWIDGEGGDAVTTVSLDDMLASEFLEGNARPDELTPSLDPTKVLLIKISAEGWDSRVLNGARRLISLGRIPYILFVYNKMHVTQRGCDPMLLVRNLFTHGYRIYYAGVYIYREQELQTFLAGMEHSTELLFILEGFDY